MLLENKVAIITGGAVGIGKGTAMKFAEEGCSVAIVDINLDAAKEVVEEIIQKGGDGLAVKCDVTEISQVKTAVDQVIQKYGRIDILMNNAGGMVKLNADPVEDLSEEEWDKVYQLNLKSTFYFTKYVVPVMKEQKNGKIINLSSIGAIQPPHHVAHYNSAKAAALGFTTDLAGGLAPFGINVNAILPGPIRTEFYSQRTDVMNDTEKDAFFEMLGTKVPLRRVGSPEDIAGAALFFASELSSFITAQSLYVAGGLPFLPAPAN